MRRYLSFLSVAAIVCFASVSVRADLVSQWTFDGTLADNATGANDGTYLHGSGLQPVYVEDRDGNPGAAIEFDGAGMVSIAQTTGMPIHDQPAFTLTMWVKGATPVAGIVDRRIFSEASTTNATPLFNLGTDNNAPYLPELDLYYRPTAGTTVDHRRSVQAVFDDTWHHIAWIDDNGQVVLYVDGIRDATDFSYVRGTMPTDTTTIGGILRAAQSHWFIGAIDDVRYYNTAITSDELYEILTGEACPAESLASCDGLTVDGPPAGQVGLYTLTAAGSSSAGDVPIFYTFTVEDAEGNVLREQGPSDATVLEIGLGPGTWTVSVLVDDNPLCTADAETATCSTVLEIAPPPQLVSHWTFDGTLMDETDNANDGTFFGAVAPTFVEGFDGTAEGALYFDANAVAPEEPDYVEVAPNSNLPIYYYGTYTVAMWVQGDPQQDKRVYAEGYSKSTTPLVNIGTDSTNPPGGKVDVFMRNNANGGSGHRLSDRDAFDGTWHHIAWVDENGKGTLYIDGLRDAGNFNYTRAPLDVDRVSIGGILRAAPCCWYTGAIDDVRVYNYALSAAEVSDLVPEDPDCGDADTHCTGITIQGSNDNLEGDYTITASGTDDSGDTILYTITVKNEAGDILQQLGPGEADTLVITLIPGTYTVTALVDDAIRCKDEAADAVCTDTFVVFSEPPITVAYWPFDGDLTDPEGGNDGTFGGLTDPMFGEGYDCTNPGAIDLNGAEYVLVPQSEQFPISKRSTFTFAAWVKGPQQADKRIFSESSSANANALFNIGTDNTGATGAVDFFLRPDAGAAIANHVHSTGIAFDDTWHHIAWVDDFGAVVLYIDGEPDATDFSYTRTDALAFDITTIGGIFRPANATQECCFFTGAMDEVYLFNYALSQADVLDLVGDGPSDCCPEDGDTHCNGLTVEGPTGNAPGTYTATADATDDSGDAIIYTFTATPTAGGDAITVGPQAENVAQFELTLGEWEITVTLDDDELCDDVADDATCTETVTVVEAGVGPFRRGDTNGDGGVDLSDAVSIFNYLFLGGAEPSCLATADTSGQGEVNITSGIYLLNFLFLGGPSVVEPYPGCGTSTVESDATLGCVEYTLCP